MTGLILTVGSNPLPVVVSALALRPQKAYLLGTEKVGELVRRAASELRRRQVEVDDQAGPLTEAAAQDIPRLRDELARLPLPWDTADLNYTGGTKLMSVEIHAYWRERNRTGTASYLAEDGCLVLGGPHLDQHHRAVTSVRLALDDLVRLHFRGEKKQRSDHHQAPDGLRARLAARIADYVKKNGWKDYKELLPLRYMYPEKADAAFQLEGSEWKLRVTCAHAADEKNFKDGSPFLDIARLGEALGEPWPDLDSLCAALDSSFAGSNHARRQERRLDTAKYLLAEWLEVQLAASLAGMRDAEGRAPFFHEVAQDVVYRSADGEEFQADVIAIHGYRACLFTCTTESRQGMLKQKLFEGLHRASRVGGEHARVALVCMSENPTAVLAQARADGWEGYDRLRVFAEQHLRGEAAPCQVDGESLTLEQALRRWVPAQG